MTVSAIQAVDAQQSLLQQQIGIAVLRQSFNARQSVANLVQTAAAQPPAGAAPSAGGRGSLVDILV